MAIARQTEMTDERKRTQILREKKKTNPTVMSEQTEQNEKQPEVEWNQSFEMLTIAEHNLNWWLYAIY